MTGPSNTNNVSVMVVQYRPSPADNRSPEAQTIGSGELIVFTGGMMVHGIWSRADRLSPIQMVADDGTRFDAEIPEFTLAPPVAGSA